MSRTVIEFALLVSLTVQPALRSQSVVLKENSAKGDCFHIQLKMQLEGKLQFRKGDKVTSIPLTAQSNHSLRERTLNVGKQEVPGRVVREYDEAKAQFDVNGHASEKTFRKECKTFVVQRPEGETFTWCTAEPLYRSELELTQHLDTLALPGLLPGKAIEVGKTWKLSNDIVQVLGHFDGLVEHSLEGKLESVKDNQAHFSIQGKAKGIELGAMVNLEIQASGRFDLKQKRIVWLEWKLEDNRDQGPVSPALSSKLTTTVTRTAIVAPDSLKGTALKEVTDDFKVAPLYSQLEYVDPKGQFSFLYDRNWHIVAQSDKQLVMRLLDRGDFVAQVNFNPWPTVEKGTHTAAEDFIKAMDSLKGWKPQQKMASDEVPSRAGLWMYRHSVAGELEGVEVIQNFYLVSAASGKQLQVTFTLTPKQAQRLGNREIMLVNSIDLK